MISLSVRFIFFLIFLSCPFHFTLLSLQFPSLFPSGHSIFLVCPIIFLKIPNVRACSFHILFIVLDSLFSSMPVYASFEFFISSDVLLSSFHFTLLYVRLCHLLPLSFHVRYFHVLPLSVHILSLSLHAMHKISQTFPFVLSCPSDFPVISLSVRLIFFLIFLSCPFHFTLLSLQFPSLFPSSHSIFLVCPII